MNRYPQRQRELDDADRAEHGRVAGLRPGATVEIRGLLDRGIGPAVLGRALLAAVSEFGGDKVLVATREYGRAWFHTQGHAFAVVKEVC